MDNKKFERFKKMAKEEFGLTVVESGKKDSYESIFGPLPKEELPYKIEGLENVAIISEKIYEQLRDKEKAIDILKDKINVYELDGGYFLIYNEPPIPVNCCKPITKEEYEILKKAGIL